MTNDEIIIMHLPISPDFINKNSHIQNDSTLIYNPSVKKIEAYAYAENKLLKHSYQLNTTNKEILSSDNHKTDKTLLLDNFIKKTDISCQEKNSDINDELKNKIQERNQLEKNNINLDTINSATLQYDIDQSKLILSKPYKCLNFKSWPKKTNIACWWCCHTFTSPPIGIPISMTKDIYNVDGIFCSFECCKAYIFSNYNTSDLYEKFTLLKRMKRDIVIKNKLDSQPLSKICMNEYEIKSAPPRECLKLFGGFMDINTFRVNEKQYNIYHLPIKPSSRIIDHEVNIPNTYNNSKRNESHKKNYIPLDMDEVDIAMKNMKKRLSKQVDNKSCLEKIMNLHQCN